MAELATLARPYAEAAFKRAKETNFVPEWSAQLQFLSAVAQNPEFSKIANNPRLGKEKVAQLMLDICAEQVQGEAINLIKLLVANAKLSLLPNISLLFEQLKAEDEGYVNVDLYSAYALTKAEQNKYSAMLEKQLHKKINVSIVIDKSLIGGILAKAGDKVIDGSIRGRIQQLAKRL